VILDARGAKPQRGAGITPETPVPLWPRDFTACLSGYNNLLYPNTSFAIFLVDPSIGEVIFRLGAPLFL